MKALLAVGVAALAGLQACDLGGGPNCGTVSAQKSPLFIYARHDTVYADLPPAPQALRGEIPVRPAAATKDTYPKPFIVCVTIYAGPLPK